MGSAEGAAERFYLRAGYRPVRFRTAEGGRIRTVREFASRAEYAACVRPCAGFVVMEKDRRD